MQTQLMFIPHHLVETARARQMLQIAAQLTVPRDWAELEGNILLYGELQAEIVLLEYEAHQILNACKS